MKTPLHNALIFTHKLTLVPKEDNSSTKDTYFATIRFICTAYLERPVDEVALRLQHAIEDEQEIVILHASDFFTDKQEQQDFINTIIENSTHYSVNLFVLRYKKLGDNATQENLQQLKDTFNADLADALQTLERLKLKHLNEEARRLQDVLYCHSTRQD